MGEIIGAVVTAILRFTWGALTEWHRRRKYEEALRRAAEVEALLQSKRQAGETEEALAEVVAEAERAKAEQVTAKEKLDWIHQFNHPEEGEK